MKKLYRSTLFAGVLAFGVVACGDDVSVVDPGDTPHPPLTVQLSGVSINVGESANLAAQISGGNPQASTSWTCESSNTSIVTVSESSTGCLVTAQGMGNTTVTVTVTRGSLTGSASAQVSVAQLTQAQVTIQSINKDGSPADIENISGQIDVVLNVDPGDETLQRVDLFVDDEIVASQTFSPSALAELAEEIALADDPAEVAVPVTLSFNTARFDVDEEAGTATVRHLNGEHVISAQLTVAGAETPRASNTIALTFNNADRFLVQASTDGNQAMASDGRLWVSGAVTARAIPVMYSGRTVTGVSMNLYDNDTEMALGGGIVARTATEAPFDVTWPTSGDNGNNVGSIELDDGIFVRVTGSVAAGNPGPITSADAAEGGDPNFLRLDNVPPSLDNLERAIRASRWVNGPWNFGASTNPAIPTGDIAAITRTDGGVSAAGGNADITLEFAAGPATDDVEVVESGEDLAESPNNATNVLRIAASDLLGNTNTRWFDGSAAGQPNTAGGRTAASANGRWGVDLTPPTLEFTAASSAEGAAETADPLTYNALFFDPVGATGGASGFEADPVATVVRRDNAAQSNQCLFGGTGCPFQNVALPWNFADEGYVRITFRVFDRAGNMTEAGPRIGLRDTQAPTVGNVSVPVSLTGGQPANFQVAVSDNVDLGEAQQFLAYGATEYGFAAPQVLGEYGLPLATSTTVSETAPFIRGVETATGGTPDGNFVSASGVTYVVSDVAGNADENTSAFNFTRPGGAKVSFNDDFAISNWAVASSEAGVCSGTGDCATFDETSTELTPTLEGTTTGLANNPFTSRIVVMWRLAGETRWKIVGTSTATGASDDGLGNRTWSFTPVTFTAPAGMNPAIDVEFVVVGIDGAGDALVSDAVTVGVENP